MYIPEIPPMIAGTPQQQLLALREYLIRTTRSIEEELSSMYDEIHTEEPPEPTEPELIRRTWGTVYTMPIGTNKFEVQINIGVEGYTPIGITSLNWAREGSGTVGYNLYPLISAFYATGNGVAVISGIMISQLLTAQNYDFSIDVLYMKNKGETE